MAALSVFYQVVLRPIAAPEPERLVDLSETGMKPGNFYSEALPSSPCDIASAFSYPMLRDLEALTDFLHGDCLRSLVSAPVSLANLKTLAGRGMLVSGSYFGVLELQPAVGRLIGPVDEPNVGESAVAVLSYDYWRNASAVLPTSSADH